MCAWCQKKMRMKQAEYFIIILVLIMQVKSGTPHHATNGPLQNNSVIIKGEKQQPLYLFCNTYHPSLLDVKNYSHIHVSWELKNASITLEEYYNLKKHAKEPIEDALDTHGSDSMDISTHWVVNNATYTFRHVLRLDEFQHGGFQYECAMSLSDGPNSAQKLIHTTSFEDDFIEDDAFEKVDIEAKMAAPDEGEEYTITCTANNKNISILRNFQEVKSCPDKECVFTLNLDRRDTGSNWTCAVKSVYIGMLYVYQSKTVTLLIEKFAPRILSIMQTGYKSLECVTDSALPRPEIWWTKNQEELTCPDPLVCTLTHTYTDGEYGGQIAKSTLTVTEDHPDLTSYKCMVNGSDGVLEKSTIRRHYPTEINMVQTFPFKHVNPGQIVTLKCIVNSASPTTQIWWTGRGIKLECDTEQALAATGCLVWQVNMYSEATTSSTLTLSANRSRQGEYGCKTLTENGDVLARHSMLFVKATADVDIKCVNNSLEVGSVVTLNCSAQQSEVLLVDYRFEYRWFFRAPGQSDSKPLVAQQNLNIDNLDKDLLGIYTCKANSNFSLGEAEVEIYKSKLNVFQMKPCDVFIPGASPKIEVNDEISGVLEEEGGGIEDYLGYIISLVCVVLVFILIGVACTVDKKRRANNDERTAPLFKISSW